MMRLRWRDGDKSDNVKWLPNLYLWLTRWYLR